MPERVFVTSERMRHVAGALRQLSRQVTQDEFLEVLDQLGWFDHFYYSEEGRPQLHQMTDLQSVCLAAALRVYLEANPR